ncbi:PREDICTED: uncharacterized protein LOC108556493 [Nicrophorus vespilloides]|uniref:Uncharacterized protein LOC108556493 n=1 Tax=Nicrophorus vespilloides TaxID=110193 RepID=A0ABM1M0L7_NICVS|nr:PREDICTED: uncharacterized protein LOC108556493 [Nicrophorus vespilloides]
MSGNQENDTSRRPETEDAQFNISNQNAPNRVMFYFKHVDTDSDMEKIEQLQNIALEAEAQTNSETSEEEWTYSQKTPNKIPDYRKIVQEVEEMVSPIKQRVGNPTGEPALNKMTRIKQWLNMDNNKPEDSCDASSEDEENESESSEEQNESIATYKARESLNASCTDLGGFFVSTPKVVYRQRHQKSNIKGQRPSSIACITQLSKSSQRIEQDAPTYSISESALHTMPLTGSLSNNQGNSTSSTVEDSCAILNEENSSPIRRKRFKLKKKASCVLRKMDSASPYNGAASRELRSGTLVKSGSFSGCGCKSSNCDRQTVSDPSATPVGQNFETSATSGADTDEDKRARRMPMFKLGAKTNFAVEGERDDSPGKFSLTTNEEQSIPCDEAWDGYQEKYSSEAYSEAPDSDAARRLWEFGEDYRTHFGSQSDWSAQSSHLEFSPQFPRKCFTTMNVIDSDQEANNLRQLLKTSRNQLHYTDNIFQKQENLGIETYLINNDTKELTSTCDRHINCLADEKCDVLSPLDKKDISDLIMSWQKLKDRILKMQEYRSLQSEILRLTQLLNEIQIPAGDAAFTVNNIEDLSRDIDFYSAELSNIEEHKKKLLIVNVAVNHFMTENADYNSSSLKSNVSELYRIWYEINNSATERLNRLNLLLQSWKMLETRLDQLRGDLRDDEQTLGALDSALQGGTFSNQMASSVRGVAKLLSETKTEGCSFSEMLTEGSFSDSGISDEGSEHDLGERERRLSAIRRLVRQLEIVMAPDSAARVRMRERLAAAEEELKTLQNKCRSIIVRTAVSAAAPLSESVVAAGPSGDPGDDGPATKTASWFKRVVRASISFHFAIMALLFVACLLEPHCCDNMNNMQMSMNPQLQYVRGTPPI